MNTTLTYANIEDVLTKCFLEYWQERTPVVLKNALQRQMPDDVHAWVYYTVQRTANRQDSFGCYPRITRVGRVFAEVFVDSGLVTGLQNQYLADIVYYYERLSWQPLRVLAISQLDLPDGAHRRASITGDGRWFGTQINVQWAFDEVNKGVTQDGSSQYKQRQLGSNKGVAGRASANNGRGRISRAK